jgi:hypothetical protein
MPASTNKSPPALKHGAFSATTILPGESETEFKELHQSIIAELNLEGVLEQEIGSSLAHRIWRNEHLAIFLTAERAQARCIDIQVSLQETGTIDLFAEARPAAEKQAREELGAAAYNLVEMGDGVTLDGFAKQIGILERLDRGIEADYKRLLLLRGVKSLSVAPKPVARKRFPAPDSDKSAGHS